MRRSIKCLVVFITFTLCSVVLEAQTFTLDDIKSYPFPTELTAAKTGSRIAWAMDEQGKRNVYVAEGPAYTPRKLTSYNQDDGQEITSLSLSNDGNTVVYVRGGDHGSNWGNEIAVNPSASATPTKIQLWSVPFAGGEAKILAEGDDPVISPNNRDVAFLKNGQVWLAHINGEHAPKQLFTARGSIGSLQWSPGGERLAFVSGRTDHAIIGVFTDSATPLKWIAPSFYRDRKPMWSPDGSKIVFARTPGGGGKPDSVLVRKQQPWSIWTADVQSGEASQLWNAPNTLEGSVPGTNGGINLHWAAGNRIVFLSYQDGWPHLYSIASSGGKPLLLTPGPFMAEHIKLSSDGKWLVFAANTGPDKSDIDRRHVVRVPVDNPSLEVLTPGAGLEWSPVITGDGSAVAMISATAQRPPLPAVMSFNKGAIQLLGQDLIPKAFPQNTLVVPRQVIYTTPDGVKVHAQLFEPAGQQGKKPAVIYVHGGPQRQMLLGWHYSEYYSNAYAINQYLASLGMVVLSINYRLGIGYGYNFHLPRKGTGAFGASEYRDIRAGAIWLASQPFVQADKIGIYGGSYGGFLTAMALAKDSKLFAAGVDIHGVHDFTAEERKPVRPDRYEQAPDAVLAEKVAWESSPVAYVKTWKSPVLIIHADDDRNVSFSQSTDLVRRLEAEKVPLETLVIVDDTHHWMKYSNAVKVAKATAGFLRRKLMR